MIRGNLGSLTLIAFENPVGFFVSLFVPGFEAF